MVRQPCLIVTYPPGVTSETQVGAVTNTFNVPGVVGNCFFLKTAEDAKAIRERVNACFELANLPDSTEEDRKRLLSFVVVCPPLITEGNVSGSGGCFVCAGCVKAALTVIMTLTPL